MVLEHTVERIVVGQQYCDIPLQLYMVRGENVVLMAEIDEEKEDKVLQKVSLELISELQKKERLEREEQQKLQRAQLKRQGLSCDETERIC